MMKVYITKEVAKMLRVSETRVRNMIHQGRLAAFKEGRKGGFRITEDAVNEYIKNSTRIVNQNVNLQ